MGCNSFNLRYNKNTNRESFKILINNCSFAMIYKKIEAQNYFYRILLKERVYLVARVFWKGKGKLISLHRNRNQRKTNKQAKLKPKIITESFLFGLIMPLQEFSESKNVNWSPFSESPKRNIFINKYIIFLFD